MWNALRTVIGIGVLGYVAWTWIPHYREFDADQTTLEQGTYWYVDISGDDDTPVRVEIEANNGNFDASMIDGKQFDRYDTWLAEGGPEPKVSPFRIWRNVAHVDESDIPAPASDIYLVIDNTDFAGRTAAGAIDIRYELSEKY